MYKPVHIVAKDGENLAIVAGLVQDSLFPMSDTQYDTANNTFVAVLNRFCWEQADDKAPYIRTHSILYFNNVVNVTSQGVDQSQDRIYDLLSIIPTKTEQGHFVHLTLAGGGVIRLACSRIKLTLKDVGDVWESTSRPVHESADLANTL